MKKCRFCAEEILDEAEICKHCGKKQTPSKALKYILVCLVVLVAFLALLAIIGSVGEQGGQSAKAPTGTTGRLYREGATQIPAYIDKQAALDSSIAIRQNDDLTLKQMITGGRVFFVPNGSRVEVIDMDVGGAREVRLMNGEKGWVSSNWITQ